MERDYEFIRRLMLFCEYKLTQAERVKLLRKTCGGSVARTARCLGVTERTLSNWASEATPMPANGDVAGKVDVLLTCGILLRTIIEALRQPGTQARLGYTTAKMTETLDATDIVYQAPESWDFDRSLFFANCGLQLGLDVEWGVPTEEEVRARYGRAWKRVDEVKAAAAAAAAKEEWYATWYDRAQAGTLPTHNPYRKQ